MNDVVARARIRAGARRTVGRALLAAAVLAALVSGCEGPTEVRSVDGNSTFRSVRTAWYRREGGSRVGSFARPAVVGSMVIAGTADGRVIAREARSGDVRWSTTVGGGRIAGANIVRVGDRVVVPSSTMAFGLDLTTGDVRWRWNTPIDSFAPAGIGPGQLYGNRIDHDDERVFLPVWGGTVTAVGLEDGAERWTWRDTTSGVSWRGATGVRISGDTLYASLFQWRREPTPRRNGLVVALDRQTGTELWRMILQVKYDGLGVDPDIQPAVWKELLYVGTGDGALVAVDRFSTSVRWRRDFEVKHGSSVSPAIEDDILYHYGADDFLYALNPADGTTRWRTRAFQGSRELLITPRRVYHTNGGYLNILNRQTGRFVARVTPPDETEAINSPAAFVDGIVVVSISSGTWAFREP